ncbi:TrfB-related DNA-binding protein [Burkholderia cepacia]|uniref:TrfB-related DNA-binding protein n=1 Tax=Burkholderia cepacia TaxID=292 RepID=UPI0018C60638|nr:TrfB-related DNA-binding protein [Burkholderia cepacia]
MSDIYKTVTSACGQVPRGVFVKATKRLQLSPESYRIAEEVFLDGYRQATVARHVGVPRQRVHVVCRGVLQEIQKLIPTRSAE